MIKHTTLYTVFLTNPEVILYRGTDAVKYEKEILDAWVLRRAGFLIGREIRAFHEEPMEPETHVSGCVCADCSGADLTAEND